jgi:hypothetical protein
MSRRLAAPKCNEGGSEAQAGWFDENEFEDGS